MRSSVLTLGAALLALACSGCDHTRAPASSAEPAAAATGSMASAQPPGGGAATGGAGTESAPPPAAAATTTADTAAKPAPPPAIAPAVPVGAPVPGSPDEVHRITLEETDALRQQGRVVIVDVRDQFSYGRQHIAGAVHIPLDSLAARMDELPRDKPIVTYCA